MNVTLIASSCTDREGRDWIVDRCGEPHRGWVYLEMMVVRVWAVAGRLVRRALRCIGIAAG